MSQAYVFVTLLGLVFVLIVYGVIRMRRRRSEPDIVGVSYRLLRLRTNLRKYHRNNTGDILDILADVETTLLDSLRYLGASGDSLIKVIQTPELAKALPNGLLSSMQNVTQLLYDLKLNSRELTDQEVGLLSEVIDSMYNIFINSKVLNSRLKHDG